MKNPKNIKFLKVSSQYWIIGACESLVCVSNKSWNIRFSVTWFLMLSCEFPSLILSYVMVDCWERPIAFASRSMLLTFIMDSPTPWFLFWIHKHELVWMQHWAHNENPRKIFCMVARICSKQNSWLCNVLVPTNTGSVSSCTSASVSVAICFISLKNYFAIYYWIYFKIGPYLSLAEYCALPPSDLKMWP